MSRRFSDPTRLPGSDSGVTGWRPRCTATVFMGLAAASMAAACGGDLPIRSEIISTRVLAVRTDVTQPLFPDPPDVASRCEALPGETVTMTPLIVDPAGPVDVASTLPIWLACDASPGLDLFACLRDQMPLELADIPECPSFDPEAMNPEQRVRLGRALAQRVSPPNPVAAPPDDPIPETPSPCRIPTRADGLAEFTVPFSANAFFGGHIEVTMVGGTPGGTASATCADRLLDGQGKVPDDCLMAVQKVALGPDGMILVLADQLGIPLGDVEVPDIESIPDADRNPRMIAFDMQEVDDLRDYEVIGPAVDAPLGGDVGPVAIETYHRLRAAARPDDLQTYPIITTVNGVEGTLDKVEYYQSQWFRSFGEMSSDSSDDPESFTVWGILEESLDEPQRPDGDRATLYYVLRDNRGGVDWWWFRLGVAP